MSGFSIEFGNKNMISGGGIDPSRMRETREKFVEEAGEVSESGEAKTFGDLMKNMIKDTNDAHAYADLKMQDVAAGRSKDLHGAVLAMEKADVQLRMISQVRNKVIEAYREILRMQV